MKIRKGFSKVLIILSAVLVIILCASSLFACNRETAAQKDRKQRERSVNTVQNEFLKGVDADWSVDMDHAKIVELDNAGDYIVTAGWLKLFGEVLVNSKLQTGKLRTFADVLRSDDGQKLTQNFSKNTELIIPLLKAVDFTPTDISNLVYDLLCSLVNDSGRIIDGIIINLDAVKADSNLNLASLSGVSSAKADMQTAKDNFVPRAAARAEMLAAFDDAREPMGELIAFAYNMSLGASDDLLNILLGGDGALTDISTSELITLISAMRENFADLKAALAGNAISNLNAAFNLIIEHFDNDIISSVLYGQIIQYAKFAYMFVDVIPAMCDIAYVAGGVFMQEELLTQLREVLTSDINDDAKAINKSIIGMKVLREITEAFSQAELKDIIDSVAVAATDYQKSVPLFILDFGLNIFHILEKASEYNRENLENMISAVHNIIGDKEISTMISTFIMVFDNAYDKYKIAYQKYLASLYAGTVLIDNSYVELVRATYFFHDFGVENAYDPDKQPVEWAKYYLDNGMTHINRTIMECNEKIVADLKLFIDDYYKENSESREALEKFADTPFLDESITRDEYEQYLSDMGKSHALLIAFLFASI